MELASWLQSGIFISHSANNQTPILLMGYGRQRRRSHLPEIIESPLFYVPDYFLEDPQPWVEFENWAAMPLREVLSRLETELERAEVPPRVWQEPESQGFTQKAQQALQEIHAGHFVKLVPVGFMASRPGPTLEERGRWLWNVLQYEAHQRQRGGSPVYSYGLWNLASSGAEPSAPIESPTYLGLLGATPELLFAWAGSGQPVYSMAVAGTRPTEGASSLLLDPKVRYEHQVVVDDIVSRLRPLGSLRTGVAEEREVGPLTHLVTEVELVMGSPPTKVFPSLIEALHPTPALGLAPRRPGWQDLATLRPLGVARGRFGAPFGVVGRDFATCLVAIRNVQWTPELAVVGAGCGLVADSTVVSEWEEWKAKQEAIQEIFAGTTGTLRFER